MSNQNGFSDDFLKDFPGGELSLDQLFPAEPTSNVIPAGTPEPAPQPQVVSQPEPPQAPAFEPIKAGTTVYNSREELERGISTKDATIEQLRQFAISQTGIDPLKKANQYAMPQGQPQAAPQSQQSYFNDPAKYLQDLVEGAEKDPKLYVDAQGRLIDERVNQLIGAYAPLLVDLAKEKAMKAISSELQDFQQVSSSPQWQEVLTELPDLQMAIQNAEGNPAFQDRLPGLYKVAYFAARGRQLPELLKQQQQIAVAPVQQAPQQARPTLTSTAVTPPLQQASRPDIRTPEGRKALIAQMEQSGVLDRRF